MLHFGDIYIGQVEVTIHVLSKGRRPITQSVRRLNCNVAAFLERPSMLKRNHADDRCVMVRRLRRIVTVTLLSSVWITVPT